MSRDIQVSAVFAAPQKFVKAVRTWFDRAITTPASTATKGRATKGSTHSRTRTPAELLREYESLQCFIRFWIEVIADTSLDTVRSWAQPISARLIEVLAAYRDELARRIIAAPAPDTEDWLQRINNARLLSLLLTAELLELCPEARHQRPYTHLGLIVRHMLVDAFELFTVTLRESQGSAA